MMIGLFVILFQFFVSTVFSAWNLSIPFFTRSEIHTFPISFASLAFILKFSMTIECQGCVLCDEGDQLANSSKLRIVACEISWGLNFLMLLLDRIISVKSIWLTF